MNWLCYSEGKQIAELHLGVKSQINLMITASSDVTSCDVVFTYISEEAVTSDLDVGGRIILKWILER
jgi:hypothetical protein